VRIPFTATRFKAACRLFAPFVAVAALAAGCGESRFLSGRYCSLDPVTVPGAVGFGGKYMAIEMGHYGSDIGGIVTFHDDAECKTPLDKAGKDHCPCAEIVAGTYEDGLISFHFRLDYVEEADCEETGPLCVEPEETPEGRTCVWGNIPDVDVELDPDEKGDLLDVVLGVDGTLSFERTGEADEVLKDDTYRNQCETLFFGDEGGG